MNAADHILLFRARTLMLGRREVLADFEIRTIQEAHARLRTGLGVVSAAERVVIEDALEAMLTAGRQDLTAAGLAA